MKKRLRAFSIIEVLISILIFSLWLVAVFVLIVSSMKLNDYNKNYIIASNLAREQIELVKNIRDSNYIDIHPWNQINPDIDYDSTTNVFQTGAYYTIENDFSSFASYPIKVEEIMTFVEWKDELLWWMEEYRLCLDSQNHYSYDCSTWNKKTPFYRYIHFNPLKYNFWSTITQQDDSVIVVSKVIWYSRGYHEFELKTILTDWKNL